MPETSAEGPRETEAALERRAKDIPYPEHLKIEKPPYRPRVMRVSTDRYLTRELHDREVERIWRRCWQFACREEQIPEVGDYVVYEIAELSFIVVRTGPEAFKAYPNACLHRGRRLCDFDGKRATEFRCMFHGFAWNIDGTMKDMTCGWDFPGTREEVSRLPECKVGVWGGFVFINPDPDCEPLADYLGELPDHFEKVGLDLSKRWIQAHVIAEIRANWKVPHEAFMETWHAYATHPQIVRTPADQFNFGNRWDDFGNWMRYAPALPADEHKSPAGAFINAEKPQDVVNYYYDYHLNQEAAVVAGDADNPDEILNQNVHDYFRAILGPAADDYHPVLMRGGDMLSVFPNFHPWGGFSRIVYRFRPAKSDPERSLMEVMLLQPLAEGQERPPPAPTHYISADESMLNAVELGHLARLAMQDVSNMEAVQQGMKQLARGYVLLSSHNEAPLRKFHDLYNAWMELPDAAEDTP